MVISVKNFEPFRSPQTINCYCQVKRHRLRHERAFSPADCELHWQQSVTTHLLKLTVELIYVMFSKCIAPANKDKVRIIWMEIAFGNPQKCDQFLWQTSRYRMLWCIPWPARLASQPTDQACALWTEQQGPATSWLCKVKSNGFVLQVIVWQPVV